MTQAEMVLDYIQKNGSIDPLRAFTDLGILRLGTRIFDLRAEGHHIITETKTKRGQNGNKTWAEYKIKPLPGEQTGERQEVGNATSENITKV